MLVQRRGRWAKIGQTLGQCLVFSGLVRYMLGRDGHLDHHMPKDVVDPGLTASLAKQQLIRNKNRFLKNVFLYLQYHIRLMYI